MKNNEGGSFMKFGRWLAAGVLAFSAAMAVPAETVWADTATAVSETGDVNPQNEELKTVYRKAYVLAHENKFSDILKLMNEAIPKYPNDPILYINRSTAYVSLGKGALAWEDANQAVLMAPEDPRAYFTRAVAYSHLKKFELAVADYDTARQLIANQSDLGQFLAIVNHNESEVLERLAGLRVLDKKYEEALSYLDQDLALNPKNFRPYLIKSDLYRRQGDHRQAQLWGGRGNAIILEMQGELAAAGSVYTEIKEYDKALALFAAALEKNPNDAAAYSCRGIAYAQMGRPEEAVKDFTKAIEIAPDAMDYNNRGNAYRELKQYDLAHADLEKSYAMDPKNEALWDTMGMLAYDEGHYEDAVKWLTKSLNAEPYSEGYTYRGKAYEQLGKKDLAAADAKKAAEWKIKEDNGEVNR